MPTSGDVVHVDLGVPTGSEAGLTRPAVIITAARVLARDPKVVQIVPLTTTLRGHGTEVAVLPDGTNGLAEESAAQCQHIRAVAVARIEAVRGNVGPVLLAQIRETLATLLDL